MDIDERIKQKFKIKQGDTLPFRAWGSKREDMHRLFAELGFTYGAEVGVARGVHARHMFRRIPNLKLLLVDPWVGFGRNSNEHMELVYKRCLKMLRNRNVVYMRKPSMEAAKEVPNLSLDFVYIDGIHDFDNAMTDLIQWSPKVKIGGIISGHDYGNSHNFGVVEAVRAYTYVHNIHDYYITGQVRNTDEYPSFFWVKK